MAADSRQFVDHFELDGSSVYNEDKRLGELKDKTAVTSISTSSQYVALQDTDGNLVKINPASFQEAVRNTLAGLLANNDKGTTISGIPALSGSGSSIDFGSITAANLASVLGAALLTRRSRLSSFSLTTLQSAVSDQNLEKYGLRVGDYTTINGHTYVIAGLNCMKGSHAYTCTSNHVGLIVIPHTTQAWNASGNTYTGADSRGAGYLNSDLHYYLKNTVLPMAQTDLGSSHLISHNKLLTNAVNTTGYNRYGSATGCSSNWAWEDTYISALTEMQVYGGTVWSSSGYDTGEADQQLEVFQHFKHTDIFGNEYIWLRDVVSASHAAIADRAGLAAHAPASNAFSVAALILFK